VLLHIDTDIGGDIDDLCALAMVLHWPGAELAGITTVADDGGRRAGYVRHVLVLAGQHEVPLAAGADVSSGCFRVTPGYPPEADFWPAGVPPLPGPLPAALDLLAVSIQRGATVVAIGPFTNLRLLDERHPGLLARADLYLVGGTIFPPRRGYPQWGADMDWNVQEDIRSAQYVFEHAEPTIVPVVVTLETYLRRAYLLRLQAADAVAQLVARQAEAFARLWRNEERLGRTHTALPDDTINFQYDPLTCAIALGWREGVHIEELPLRWTLRDGLLHGQVARDGKPTRIVTAVDGDTFSQKWLDVVAAPPDVPGRERRA
jgi:inosine-uridine nucleoside N-ribohydrolase